MWDIIIGLVGLSCLAYIIGLFVWVVVRNLTLLDDIEDLQRQKAEELERSWQWLDDMNARVAEARKNPQTLYERWG